MLKIQNWCPLGTVQSNSQKSCLCWGHWRIVASQHKDDLLQVHRRVVWLLAIRVRHGCCRVGWWSDAYRVGIWLELPIWTAPILVHQTFLGLAAVALDSFKIIIVLCVFIKIIRQIIKKNSLKNFLSKRKLTLLYGNRVYANFALLRLIGCLLRILWYRNPGRLFSYWSLIAS